jgi:hypothetical protein
MREIEKKTLLRIYLSEGDHIHGKPLYEEIVKKARELKLAGATVLRGLMGFGAQSHLHSAKILRLAEDLPVVIEIVEVEERLRLLCPFLEEHAGQALVTMETVRVIRTETS